MGAKVVRIGNTIFVFILDHRGAIEMPAEHGHGGVERARSVAVSSLGVALALVVELVVGATLHFFGRVVVHVLEVTHGEVEADTHIDIVSEVETQARGDVHRVGLGVTRVIRVLDAHFAGVFEEHIDRFVHEQVEAHIVDNGVGFIGTEGMHIAAMAVQADRSANLGEVESHHETCTRSPRFGSVRLGVTGVVQVPHVAGTHTGGLLTRRGIEVEDTGKCKYSLFVAERGADLHPHVDIALTGFPHAVPCGGAAGFVGMFIVNGENHTEVQEGQHTDGHVEIAREGTGPVLKIVLVASFVGEASPARERPGIVRNISTRSDRETPLTKCICIVLMEAV